MKSKIIIFFLVILLIENALGQPQGNPSQTASPTPQAPAKPKNIYVDKDGDTVTVLDYELRKKLNYTKDVKPTLVYDNAKEIEKARAQMESNILTNKKRVIQTYTVEKETDLRDLSKKLYGTPKRWAELQVLNEDFLKSSTLSPGMKIKYIVETPPAPAPAPAPVPTPAPNPAPAP